MPSAMELFNSLPDMNQQEQQSQEPGLMDKLKTAAVSSIPGAFFLTEHGRKFASDAGNSIKNYVGGIAPGWKESQKADEAFDQSIQHYGPEDGFLRNLMQGGTIKRDVQGNYIPAEGYTQEDVQRNLEWKKKAASDFVHETLALPAMVVAPQYAIPAVLGSDAAETYNKTNGNVWQKLGNAAREITVGPAIDTLSDPNFVNKFKEHPAATTGSTAMALLQAIAPVYGAWRGGRAVKGQYDAANAMFDKVGDVVDNFDVEAYNARRQQKAETLAESLNNSYETQEASTKVNNVSDDTAFRQYLRTLTPDEIARADKAGIIFDETKTPQEKISAVQELLRPKFEQPKQELSVDFDNIFANVPKVKPTKPMPDSIAIDGVRYERGKPAPGTPEQPDAYRNMFGGNGKSALELLDEIGKPENIPARYTVSDSADFAGTLHETQGRVESIIRAYNREFPDDPILITDGARPQNADYGSPTSYHKSGEAVDFTSPGLESDPVKRARLVELAQQHGFNEVLDEYSNPSAYATGGHVHMGGLSENRYASDTAYAPRVDRNMPAEPMEIIRTEEPSREVEMPEEYPEIDPKARKKTLEQQRQTAWDSGDLNAVADTLTDSPLVANALRKRATLEKERSALAEGTQKETLDIENIQRGQEAVKNVIEQQADIIDAMHRSDLGSISFYWGDSKGGIRHIIERRTAQGYDGKAIARQMPEVIARGKAGEIYGPPGGERVNINFGDHTAVLSLHKFGNRHTWLLTGWENHKEALSAAGEGYGSLGATRSGPMRTRSGTEKTSSNFNISPDTTDVNGRENMASSGLTIPANSPRPAAPSGVQVPEMVTRKAIVNKVDELFTAVKHGRLGKRGVLGWFDRNSEVIRTKDYADFRAIMHEIGHYLDKGLNLRSDAAFDSELIGAVGRRFGKAYDHLTHEQKRGEGIAEFIHDYTTDPAKAQQEFPGYYQAFEQRLAQEPQVRGKVNQIKKMLETWHNQAARERVKGSISFGDDRGTVEKVIDAAKDPVGTAEAIAEKGRTAFEAGYDSLVDQLAPLGRIMKEIKKVTGEKIPLAQDVFKQAWLTRGWAGKAQTLYEKGLPKQGVPALKSIIKSVENDVKGFSAYVVALREMDIYKLNAKTLAEAQSKLRQAIAELNNLKTKYAQAKNNPYNSRFERNLELGKLKDEISRAETKVSEEQRGLDSIEEKYLKTTLTKQDAISTVKEGRKKPNFYKAQKDLVTFQNHLLDILVDAGIKDRASVEAMKAKWPNYAPFFREFDEAAIQKFFGGRGFGNVSDPVKSFKGSTRDIINPLESVTKNTYHFINLAERNKVGRLFVDLAQKPGLGKIVEKVTGNATSRDSTFSVWNNGKKEVFQTTPELYRAIMLLDREPAQGIMKIFSIPAGWLRAGAVLSPEFIVRNPVRDAWSAFIYSRYGFIPGIDTFRGLMHLLKKSDLYWEYMNSGAAHSTLVSLDRDYLSQSIKQVMSKTTAQKAASVINPKTYIDILRAFSEATEMATRLAAYENARTGYSGVLNRLFSKERTPLSMEEAALGARDITLDFSRSGVWGKEANKYMAFWNATVQGADKMVRAFKENPVGTSTKTFMSITLPSIVLYYMNRDDPRYQELPQWQKDLFWIIPTKDTLIKIPKPFELGILFGTSVERMLQWADNKKKGDQQAAKHAFKGFGDTAIEAMLPSWIPTAMLPIIEWTTNYSFFMDRNIVPQSQAKLPPKLQYGPNTSAIGKAVGETLNVSPSKVDNTVRGYTGGLGGLAMTASDLVAGEFEKRPSMKVSEYPGIRAFTATPYKSSQSVQEFYDKLNEQEQLYNEYKQTRVKPEGFNQTEYQRLKGAERLMTHLHQQEKEILANTKMSSEEKRNRLDQMKIKAVNYARIGLGNKENVK